jgi:hypothetical protein
MVAAEKSDVMSVTVAKFYYFFTDSELKKMKAHVVKIDKEDVQSKVLSNFKKKM